MQKGEKRKEEEKRREEEEERKAKQKKHRKIRLGLSLGRIGGDFHGKPHSRRLKQYNIDNI